jgi:eukaryotic-like serine/threonine-protein kinase
MSLTSGTRLGRYEILTQIGAGGMGKVYLAQDSQLDRTIALKILHSEIASDVQRMRRFIQEAKAASSLNHPNILTIYEIGKSDSIDFIATEFIDGETLRGRMSTARVKLIEALDIAIQVAGALSAAHAAGIINRDIKPENIMVRRDGYVKVLDFGLAKLTEHRSGNSEATTMVNTDDGVVMGTVAYMSPEQARGLAVDARTDIWSLGVVLYEMVAGCAPFAAATPTDAIISIAEREPAPLARHAAEVPVQLERIVKKALAKDREERYQTVKDLALDLKNLRRELDIESEIERTVPPELRGGVSQTSGARAAVETANQSVVVPTASFAEQIKRHKLGVAIVGVVLVAAVVSYFAYFRRDRSSPTRQAITSVAVMPLVNASNNPDAEYLSDGISESLINSLSQLPQLKVIARSSSFKFKGTTTEPAEVAKALGVRAIVTGRVIQLGDRHTKLGRKVAIKLLPAEYTTNNSIICTPSFANSAPQRLD